MKIKEHAQKWLDEKKAEGYDKAGEDLLQHGCVSGMVSDLIYYSDTTAFFEEHKEEIDGMLREDLVNHECGIHELLRDWDKTDPLAMHYNNQTLLAWWSFECAVAEIMADNEE